MTSTWTKLWTRKVSPEEREEWLYEVKAEGDALERTLNSIEELAPDLIGWVEQGVSWTINESTGGREADRKLQEEVDELLKRFRDLLGLEEGVE